MLKVRQISAGYSGVEILQNVSIKIEDGEFVSIVGSNGAGKSTLLKTISGTVKCFSGEIHFMGINITQMDPHNRTELGVVHIPEGRRIFKSLTVAENLDLGAYRSEARASAAKSLETVLEIFPILEKRHNQLAGNLSGGEQQMLAIGRGLMAVPRLLMLDEPSLGLSPLLADFIFDTIRDIHQKMKLGILLVEQRALEALELCNHGYVLESGRMSMSGDREALMGNPIVQRAYLGTI